MVRFRLSAPARADLTNILAVSRDRWGADAERRYAATLSATMRAVASNPAGPLTRSRTDLAPGVRSLHARHARVRGAASRVKAPAHIVYYRIVGPETVDILRVLHERMDPGRHLGFAPE
ncbi:MAG: type II toxin-antitoxin system RelE/ParE family toxin [Hyphomicrobiales bacterium]|nr:type II toxin-antitoxin system RelE/ParE family toxin [Hyphomicrobiales bacterium]